MRAARVKRLGVLTTLVVALVWAGPPADAGSSDLVTGALAFEGAADLSAGTWAGTVTGQLSGSYRETDGQVIPWSALFAQPGTASTTSVELLGCAAGTVTGRLHTKTRDYGQEYGLWVNHVIPRSIIAVKATFEFVWHRAGAAGALVITGAVVDVQLYTEPWIGFETPAGWVRVVDSSHVTAGAGVAQLDTGDPASCDAGTWRGAVADLAVAGP